MTPQELGILALSLKVAVAATLLILPFAVGVAWLLSRPGMPGKIVLDSLVNLPLVMPPVVTGYVLLVVFGRNGPVGRFFYETFGLAFAFDWKGAALAAGVVAFPLLVRSVRISMESVDPGLEKAARTLGAGPLRTFFTVTLPLAAPGLAAGSLLAFVRGFGEFGATITFVGNIAGETRTLPLAVYSFLQMPGGEDAALRLVVFSLIVSVAAVAASEYMVRRTRTAAPRWR